MLEARLSSWRGLTLPDISPATSRRLESRVESPDSLSSRAAPTVLKCLCSVWWTTLSANRWHSCTMLCRRLGIKSMTHLRKVAMRTTDRVHRGIGCTKKHFGFETAIPRQGVREALHHASVQHTQVHQEGVLLASWGCPQLNLEVGKGTGRYRGVPKLIKVWDTSRNDRLVT